ncbi:MAG: hypothetical protein AABX66_02015 [Nanoarchaeota archaeon]
MRFNYHLALQHGDYESNDNPDRRRYRLAMTHCIEEITPRIRRITLNHQSTTFKVSNEEMMIRRFARKFGWL